MYRSIATTCLAFTFVLLGARGLAEIPPQDRDSADYILTGTVEMIDATRDDPHTRYVVHIRIDGIERGDDLVVGQVVHAKCYQLTRQPDDGWVGPGGHFWIPETGDRIKAWLYRGNEQHRGVYPYWAERIDP